MAKAKKPILTPEELLEQALVPESEQPHRVPENWVWTELSHVAQWGSGGTPLRKNPAYYTGGTIPWVKTGELNDGYIFDTEERITDDAIANSSAKVFPPETVLIAMYGATIGRITILGIPASTNQACACAVTNSAVHFKYLFFYLLSQKHAFLKKGKGGAQPNISQEIIKQHEIPLPPLAEQQRIIAQIERLFEKLDRAKELAQNVLNSFETRKAAILHKAFTGELTAKWREENGVGMENWETVLLHEISEKIFDGPFGSNLKTDDYVSLGVRVVRLENLKNLWFDDSKQSFITEAKYKTIDRYTVYPTDLIMSTFISDEIKICQLPTHVKFAVNKADCIGIRLCDQRSAMYVLYYLSSKNVYDALIRKVHGATRPRVNSSQIKAIDLPLPSLPEQQEIVRILDSLLEKEQRAQELCDVIDKIDLMKKTILARAFRGELGTNDPCEESAITLLKDVLAQ